MENKWPGEQYFNMPNVMGWLFDRYGYSPEIILANLARRYESEAMNTKSPLDQERFFKLQSIMEKTAREMKTL